MTQKQLFDSVRALGLSIRVLDGEYRIAPKLSVLSSRSIALTVQENKAYYTNDRDDALATAKRMAEELNRN